MYDTIGRIKARVLTENLYIVLDMWLLFLCSKHNLKKPKLKFHSDWGNSEYDPLDNSITLGEYGISDSSFRKKIEPFIKYKFTSKFQKILFGLFHELVHCLQAQKYPKIYYSDCKKINKYVKEVCKNIINDDDIPNEIHKTYRNFKLEKHADKRAIFWLKKYIKD